MKTGFTALFLILCTGLPLAGCAAVGQGLAKLRVHNMDANDYFTQPAEVALVEAAADGDTRRMQQAIADGADVNRVGKQGMAPILWVVGVHPNLEGFKYLLAQGANPNTVTKLPKSFHDDRVYLIRMTFLQPDPRFMKALLEAGADPDYDFGGEGSLLSSWRADKRLAQIKLLVKYGADVNDKGIYDITPLYSAVVADSFKLATFLLSSGADPTIEKTTGSSALKTIKKRRSSYKKREDKESSGYAEFIRALKAKGYVDEDF